MAVKKTTPAPNVAIDKEIMVAIKALAPAVARLEASLGRLDPKKLPAGAVVDLLYDLRGISKMLGNLSAPFDDIVQPKLRELDEHFINTLAVGESSGIQGHVARVQVTESLIPIVKPEDWPKVWAHIKKTGDWELVNRAINRAAVIERWNDKKQVPGVGKFMAKKVSCTKLGGKKK